MDEEAASAKKIDLEYLNSCLSVETAAEMMDSEDPKVETATKMAWQRINWRKSLLPRPRREIRKKL